MRAEREADDLIVSSSLTINGVDVQLILADYLVVCGAVRVSRNCSGTYKVLLAVTTGSSATTQTENIE